MKPVIQCVTFCLLFTATFALQAATPKELSFLNWDDYMDPEILAEFQQKTGVEVKQTYFDSDAARDQLLLKTNGKGFDIALVDGSSIRILAKRGWLEPIAEADIPNLKFVYPRWRTMHKQAKDYAVPYFWGTSGIVYRQDLVTEPVTSWMDLLRPQPSLHGKIGMLSDVSDIIGAALKALGYSLNSADKGELKAAEQLLIEQAPHVGTYNYVSIDANSAMLNGKIVMSMMYSGDALMLQEYNDNIVYVIPEEGSNLWVDYLCIMSLSVNKVAAKQFINFLNQPDIAARLAQHVYYASPNQAAEALLPEDFTSDSTIYPSQATLLKSEPYTPLPPRAAKRRSAIFSRLVH